MEINSIFMYSIKDKKVIISMITSVYKPMSKNLQLNSIAWISKEMSFHTRAHLLTFHIAKF